MSESAFFQDLAILMSAAGLFGAIFSRFRWPKVIGYIIAGIIMSEYTWGGSFLADPNSIRTIGQLGVVFLMFAMGLSFSARDLRKIRSVALPAAVLDTIVMIWLGYTVGTRLFGWSAVQSLFLGVAICDSATTLLAKVIDEMGWGNRPFAKTVLGVSLCEDIITVGAIAVATGFAGGGGMSAGALALSLGWLAVFFLTVLVFGFVFVPRMLKSIGKQQDDEALVLTLLGTCFFVCYLAYVFNFSTALGAFLVGILGSCSNVRERISQLIEPLKSMFGAVFFVSVGLLVNPQALTQYGYQILLVTVVVVVGKFVNVTFASLLAGQEVKTSIQNGFSLAQIGEFAFMVAILYAGLCDNAESPMFQIAVWVSLLTTVANPTMIRISDPVGDFIAKRIPARMNEILEAYRAWVRKIGASSGSPAFLLFKAAAIKLGIYAVLMFAVSVVCSLLNRFDYSRFSSFFERHDTAFFFFAANVFSVSLVPMVVLSARSLADELAILLGGMGESRWHQSLRQLVRYFILLGVLAAFFVEWTMINITIMPNSGWSPWICVVTIMLTGILGWRYFLHAGRRATTRFKEALSAEERHDGLVKTMTVVVPEGMISRFTLPSDSPAIGMSVVSLDIRAKTGSSVVSVRRDGEITRNIGPEWTFQEGDTVVAIGDGGQLEKLKRLLGVRNG